MIISLIITSSYWLVYQYHNTEIIREYFEDKAFDNILNASMVSWLGLSWIGFSSQSQSIADIPRTLVLEIDQKYLSEKKMINDNNESTYGYLFPRGEIANLITALDNKSEKLHLKAVFLDYDLSYSMMPNGKVFSQDDVQLLNVLAKKRNYKILIPLTNTQNIFLDQLHDAPWIVPVSVSLSNSSDGVSRRFISNQNGYPSASLAMYAIAKGNPITIREGTVYIGHQKFYQQDVIENRIIIKRIYRDEGYYQSNWSDLDIVSASMIENVEYEQEEVKKGSFVFLGSGSLYANDVLKTANDDMYGIEAHVNAFMTHLYLNGPLKPVPIFIAMIVVFILSFGVNYFYDYLNSFSPTATKEFIFSFASVITMSIIMYGISYGLLGWKNVWFNWSIPLTLFAISEIVDMIIKLATRYKYNIQNRSLCL